MADFPGYSLSGVVASFCFVLLTMKQSGDFRVLGPAYPVLARVGEDALLTCQLFPKRAATHMEVRWYRSEPDTPAIARWDGAEVAGVQMEEPAGRIEWIGDGIEEGAATLKIRSVRPSDDGQYWCHFQEGDRHAETSVLLQVAGVGSAPLIHMEGPREGEVQLVCTAEGWFPEPRVSWEAVGGEKLLAVSEHHVRDEDGLFYVEDTLVVRTASEERVSCFVHNPVLQERKGAEILLTEKLQTELASLKVIGPPQPIPVRVGEDIGLTCHLSPEADAQGMEVRWVRARRHPAVHVGANGGHAAGEQLEDYRGRTTLVSDAIHEGRLSLQIRDARASDDGLYRCLFEKDGVYQEATLHLQVVAVGSSPRVTVQELADGGSRLLCTSAGWFPRPRVQWRDQEGRTLPSASETLRPDGQGLFHVETSLLITNSSTVNVTCSLSNLPRGEERTAAFSLSESRATALWKALAVLGLLLAVAAGLSRRKSRGQVNVALDPHDAARVKPALSKKHEDVSRERSRSQTAHRDLAACSASRARRGS